MVAQSPEVVNPDVVGTVPGRTLTAPDWIAARIAEMGRSWGTTEPRVSGTLWWCMVASALVEQIARAYATEESTPEPALDRLDCEVRRDGGVERIHILPAARIETADTESESTECVGPLPDSETEVRSAADGERRYETRPDVLSSTGDALSEPRPAASSGTQPGTFPDACGSAVPGTCASALRETLAAVIAPVAAVSGAGLPSLWAIAADAIGNRALDAGKPEAGARLAGEVGGKLPVPRFVEVGGRTFVRRISCCLVFEVPGCDMCTSCPKRPAAERAALLARLAADS